MSRNFVASSLTGPMNSTDDERGGFRHFRNPRPECSGIGASPSGQHPTSGSSVGWLQPTLANEPWAHSRCSFEVAVQHVGVEVDPPGPAHRARSCIDRRGREAKVVVERAKHSAQRTREVEFANEAVGERDAQQPPTKVLRCHDANERLHGNERHWRGTMEDSGAWSAKYM